MMTQFFVKACTCAFYHRVRNAALLMIAIPFWGAPPVFAQSANSSDGGPDMAVPLSLGKRYPAGSIVSSAQADQALEAIQRERARIAGLSNEEERACHEEFFMTACLTDVDERWRVALTEVRLIEAEAKRVKRRVRSEKQQAAMSAKRLARAANASAHLNSANRASPVSAGTSEQDSLAGSNTVSTAKVTDVDEQRKRAKKVTAFAEKARASKARQQQIATKKAARQAARKTKECSAPC